MHVKVVSDDVLPIADGACLSCADLGTYGKSRTVQSHRESCDISSIVAKFKRTGVLPVMKSGGAGSPVFGDFTDAPEYQALCNRVIAAQTAFSDLPVRVREKFGYDPAQLLSFLADPDNRDEAISLGLIDKPAPVSAVAGTEPAPKADLASA